MLGLAMARCKLRAIEDSCASHLDLWPVWRAKEQGVARSCAASFFTCRVYAGMEDRNPLLPTGRLGVCVLQVQGKATSGGEHVGRVPSSARSDKSWGAFGGRQGTLWVS